MKKEIKPGYTRVSDVVNIFSDLKNISPDVLQNAADRGTVVHHLCESLVLRHPISDKDEMIKSYTRNDEHFVQELDKVNKLVESFTKWYGDKKFIPTPERFYDDELMITGECDLIYKDERGLVLVDLKTPASESKSWLLQGSAYHYLAQKNGLLISVVEFIKLSKSGGKPKVYEYAVHLNLFKSVLETYRYFEVLSSMPSDGDYL